jgi:hypothetical protein
VKPVLQVSSRLFLEERGSPTARCSFWKLGKLRDLSVRGKPAGEYTPPSTHRLFYSWMLSEAASARITADWEP